MSIQLLLLSILNTVVLATSGYILFAKADKTSFLNYYRLNLSRAFRFQWDFISAASLLNLISLHMFIPLMGLAFFLKSDVNFLAVLAGILVSMQISQRIYPAGMQDNEEESLLS